MKILGLSLSGSAEAAAAGRRRRWLILGAAVAGVLAALLAADLFWWTLPEGEGPAGPEVPRSAFLSTWTSRPVLLVGFGDSVTAGFGSSEGRSYFELLVTNAPDDLAPMQGICLSAVLPNLRSTNLSLSGTTSPQHLRSQIPKLPVQPSNVLGLVVMTTGGNDIIHNYGRTPPSEGAMFGASMEQAKPWIQNYARRLDDMVRLIEARFPGGCHIFLANIYDPTDGTGSARRVGLPRWPDSMKVLLAYNRALSECAGRHRSVHLVNIHDAFLGHGLTCRQFWRPTYRSVDPHYWYFENLEDPNDRGYDALRRLFLLQIKDALAPADSGAAKVP